MYGLHGVFDGSRCQMPHRQWKDRRSSRPACHGISWWPIGWTVGEKTVNLRRVFPSALSQMMEVALGLW